MSTVGSPPEKGKMARRLRWGLGTAAVVVLFIALVRTVVMPLHAAGIGQPVTSVLNGIGWLLHLPGATLAFGLIGTGSPYALKTWLIGLALNVPLYFLVGLALRVVWLQVRPRRRSSTPPDPARRRFLTAGMRLACGAAAAGVGYAFVAEPRWFTVTNRTITLRGLPRALDGLRLVQLTDIHHGPWLSLGYIREVVRTCNALKPDLALLTGDYILQSSVYAGPVAAALAELRPNIGTVAVLGNHDLNEGAGEVVRRAFAEAGLPLIDNARRVLTPDRELVKWAPKGLAICGVEDLWRAKPSPRKALFGLPPYMPRLLLSHNPDVAEERCLLRCHMRVDLMISGHTHGGQVYIPGIGRPFVPSRYGEKYAEGLVQGPRCPVFICRGLGMATVPLRIGVPPEIAVLELHPAN
jgi:predicted MPP superfamily phosphohydrolase